MVLLLGEICRAFIFVEMLNSRYSAEFVASAESHFAANKISAKAGSTFAATVQVYWHVIQAGTSESS